LQLAGVPVGRILESERRFAPRPTALRGRVADGSVVTVVATDAPLDSRQLREVAMRVSLGLGRTGLTSMISSGDLMLALSTTHVSPRDLTKSAVTLEADVVRLNAIFQATVDAVATAIADALWNAVTMTGASGHTVEAIPRDRLRALLAHAAP
jgi:D-aminopeptidase